MHPNASKCIIFGIFISECKLNALVGEYLVCWGGFMAMGEARGFLQHLRGMSLS